MALRIESKRKCFAHGNRVYGYKWSVYEITADTITKHSYQYTTWCYDNNTCTQRLSRLPKFCTSEAKLSHNTPKNRFANILPCKFVHSHPLNCYSNPSSSTAPPFILDDCSRVKLTEIEGEKGSDYINANYLDVRREWYLYSYSPWSLWVQAQLVTQPIATS